MALQPAGEVEFEQHDVHFSGADACGPDQLIDVDGAWTQRVDNPLPFVLSDIGKGLKREPLVLTKTICRRRRLRPKLGRCSICGYKVTGLPKPKCLNCGTWPER